MDSYCCKDFEKSRSAGSDNETWGYLTHWNKYTNTYEMGSIETPINWCPWCGKGIKGEDAING